MPEHGHISNDVRERIGAAVLELTVSGKPDLAEQLLANFDREERRVIEHGIVPGCPRCEEAIQRLDTGKDTMFALHAQVAQQNCERNSHTLVGLLATAEPYLWVVVARRNRDTTYTTWVMNTTQDPHECLNLGHYDMPTLREAYADALDRERF